MDNVDVARVSPALAHEATNNADNTTRTQEPKMSSLCTFSVDIFFIDDVFLSL